MGWDYFQAQLELQEKEELDKYPPDVVNWKVDDADYKRIDPVVFVYPPHVNVDENTRVGMLNRELSEMYTGLATGINTLEYKKAVLAKNTSRYLFCRAMELKEQVQFAKCAVDKQLQLIALFLGEVDAIESSNSFFVPAPLRGEIDKVLNKAFLVESGSLAYLAQQPPYFHEICNVPDDVYVGSETPSGTRNLWRKGRLEAVANTVNRIIYLEACRCKSHPQMSVLRSKLTKCYYEVPYDAEKLLNLPDDLRQEADRIVLSLWHAAKELSPVRQKHDKDKSAKAEEVHFGKEAEEARTGKRRLMDKLEQDKLKA